MVSNSGQEARTEKGCLLGGTVNILLGQLVRMPQKNINKKDNLGRWSTFRLEENNKTIQIINAHRIPESAAPGILKSRAQCDRSTGMVKRACQYQEKLIESVSNKIR